MDSGWQEVGRQVVAARKALGWLQADLVRASGVSDATVRKIESGHDQDYRTNIKRAIEGALGWSTGHIDRLRRGEQPAVITQRDAVAGELQKLRDRVAKLEALLDRVEVLEVSTVEMAANTVALVRQAPPVAPARPVRAGRAKRA